MDENNSTYAAIFAIFVTLFIILLLAYSAIEKLYFDYQINSNKEEVPSVLIIKGLEANQAETRFLSNPNEQVIGENLTNEEADKIIEDLLREVELEEREVNKLENKQI